MNVIPPTYNRSTATKTRSSRFCNRRSTRHVILQIKRGVVDQIAPSESTCTRNYECKTELTSVPRKMRIAKPVCALEDSLVPKDPHG